MQKWVVCAKKADFYGIGKKYGIDPVTARIMRNRGVVTEEQIEEYLYGTKEMMHSPFLMKDLERAAGILEQKIKENKKICIIGDYDIDGVNASYILLDGLRRLGAQAEVKIPDRILDGYGVNETLVTQAYEEQADTILTCDNGIAAFDAIALAKKYGMTVVVTDHHEVPFVLSGDGRKEYRLVKADAIVNPKQDGCPYPYKNLCGAAVAYKLIQAMVMRSGRPDSNYERYLQFAGIATVGDVMLLNGENRIIVKEGLRQLNRTDNPGLRALILQKQLTFGAIAAYHIGFVIGPCLNASGRLDTARRALQLLLTEEEAEAARLAADLVSLNESRKEMTADGTQQAIDMIEQDGLCGDQVLVVYLPECHESIAGIIAGRIRERYHKPVFVLTKTKEGIKGSGRSIEAYSMYDEINKVGELFTKYGGHPMAAGLSMPEANLNAFREQINELANLQPEDFEEKVVIDVPMPFSYITKERIQELALLEPFGNGNEKPIFAQKDVQILSAGVVGKNRNVLKLHLSDQGGCRMEAIYYGDIAAFAECVEGKYGKGSFGHLLQGGGPPARLSFTYYPQLNSFQGMESIQIKILGFQ